ncbi:MAG: porphobilinogen deaminase [Ignavibacteria bacterium]|nr:porphobilinogen deaminase [Ignavibacteria bacterium]
MNDNFKKKYIVATRPSLLAFTQTEQTVNKLREKNPDCEFEIIKFSTHGDKVTDKPLTEFGGTGVFVKELENAILEGKADFAIHSLKDVPSDQPSGLILACFPKREDPRDIVLTKSCKSLIELDDNCIIGTGSPRRIVQIAQFKPNAKFKDLRGNIDTRLKKLHEEDYDAIVLAAAGMKRLGKEIPHNAYLPVEGFVPAIGQGIIGIECKSDDYETIEMLRTINSNESELAARAERSFMKTIGGGCKFPLAAYATINDNILTLSVMLGNHITYLIHKETASSELSISEQLGIDLAMKIKAIAGDLGITLNI